MKRTLPAILLALFTGVALGLAYAWLLAPLKVADAHPNTLRADFKDAYRAAIAASFAATGNLPRSEARLALLGGGNFIDGLNSQAQRMIANGEFTQADQLAALAMALENGGQSASTPSIAANPTTVTQPPAPPDLSIQFTETPQSFETPVEETPEVTSQPAPINPTPRPTRTPIPTLGAPFALIGQDTVCDDTLPDGLLQIFVFNARRRQVTGAQIIITWDFGEDSFFTGLKPEIGNGYADYSMLPNIAYTVRLAIGSDIASGLIAPTCQTSSGESFLGGFKLTFQQP